MPVDMLLIREGLVGCGVSKDPESTTTGPAEWSVMAIVVPLAMVYVQ